MGSKAGTKRNHTLVHGVKRLWFFAKRNLEYTLLLTIKKLKKKTACIQLFLWFCFLFLRCGLSRQIVCTGRNERWITHAILKEIKKIAFKVDGALRFWHFWEPRHHELAKQHLRNFLVFKNLKNFDGVIYIVHGPLRVLVAWYDSYFWWLLWSRTFARSEFLTTTMCSIKLDSTLHVLW